MPNATRERRIRVSFWIDPPLDAGLKALTERDGTPAAEAMRRGIRLYLEQRGVLEARLPQPKARVHRRGAK
jgi:hypothetical protein